MEYSSDNKEGLDLLKKGIYGKYQGMEYKITVDMDKNIIIMTKDKGKADKTFNYNNYSGVFKKIVQPHDLKDCVKIVPFGIIQDEEVQVLQEREHEYQVGTGDLLVGSKLKLPRIDRDAWLGLVPKDSVKLVEEKTPINPEKDI